MKLVPFAFENTPVRVADQNGDPWFVAKDVCAALGKTWDGRALEQVPADWRGMCNLHTPGGEQETVIINEAAVYKLAFRSRTEAAERFTNWVASDVLPTIRKTGGYGRPADHVEPRNCGIDREAARSCDARCSRHAG